MEASRRPIARRDPTAAAVVDFIYEIEFVLPKWRYWATAGASFVGWVELCAKPIFCCARCTAPDGFRIAREDGRKRPDGAQPILRSLIENTINQQRAVVMAASTGRDTPVSISRILRFTESCQMNIPLN